MSVVSTDLGEVENLWGEIRQSFYKLIVPATIKTEGIEIKIQYGNCA
jgi:hypothetical protein